MMIKTVELGKNGTVRDLAGRVARGISKNNCTGHAAEIAYYFLFALFPCLLSLTTLLAYLPVPDLFQVLLRLMGSFIPAEVLELVKENLRTLVTVQQGGLLSFGVLLALWTASNAVIACQSALNDAFNTEELRPYWQQCAVALLLVICFTGFVIVSLLLLFLGPRIGDWLASLANLGYAFMFAWKLLRWPVILTLMMTALSGLYRYAPALKLSWRETLPGAMTATGAWGAATQGL